MKEYAGHFPSDFGQALSLPGIGRYTAGAVLSIEIDRDFHELASNSVADIEHIRLLHADALATLSDWAAPTDEQAALREIGERKATEQAASKLRAMLCGRSARSSGAPGSRSKTTIVGVSMSSARAIPVWSSRAARLATTASAPIADAACMVSPSAPTERE